MGYSTTFQGRLNFDKPLTPAHKAYLIRFSETRRMKRNPAIAAELPDPSRHAVGLPIGTEGGYYVGEDDGNRGQRTDNSVTEYNRPPVGQPGLWCQWVPTEDGTGLEWDGGEKFYHYIAWLTYLIRHFYGPWGYVLNGEITWQGEDHKDAGKITVKDNITTTQKEDRL